MGDVIDLRTPPARPIEDHEFIADMARFADNLLSEKQVKKKYKFDDATWEALGKDDELISKIEEEKIRRIRTGQQKREKAQQLVVKAPDVLDAIMMDASASPRHRVDAIKVLDDFSATGPAAAPAADRFIIQINLGEDVLRFNKSEPASRI
jgi:hypothetical protein